MQKFLLVFLFFPICLSAQDKQLRSTLSDNQILIGKQVAYSIELQHLIGDSVVWPLITDTIIKNVEVIEIEENLNLKSGENDLLTSKKVYTITSFDTGFYALPPIEVLVNGEMMKAQAHLLAVQTFTIDSTNAIADIKANAEIPITFYDYLNLYWHYAAFAILALVLLILAFWFYKKYKSREKIVEEKPEIKIPPHQIALEKLQKLEEKKLWQSGNFKAYHSDLSEIIREYLENRFQIFALELTTDEIIRNLRLADLSAEHKSLVKMILRLSDLVKFAKEKPLASENEQVLAYAYRLINETILEDMDEIQETKNTKPSAPEIE